MLQPYQQQPFYTSVLQTTWPPGGAYYDISGVFQVNGLTPQTFNQPYRSVRPRKQSRGNPSNDSSTKVSSQTGNQGSLRQNVSTVTSPPQPMAKTVNIVKSPLSVVDMSNAIQTPVAVDFHETHNSTGSLGK